MNTHKPKEIHKLTNFGSQNINAIISKFESKSHQTSTHNQIDKKLFKSKYGMSGAKALNCGEVFYDSLLSISNGNENIHSSVAMDVTHSDVKVLKTHTIPSSRSKSFANVVSWFVFLLSSVNGAIATTFAIVLLLPKGIIKGLIYPGYRLLFGTLYPAYASYKAVRTKNVKEYVKWMMYWIVFALFSCTETFTDIFLSWFPFYYEFKVVIVLWLLSPATKGSSTLYRKFVHPMLTKREQEIDEYISQAKEKGYSAVLQYGSRGVNYATSVIMQTALKGGGNLVSSLKKSYSLSDLSEPDIHRSQDEIDNLTRSQRVLRPRTHSTRSSSSGRNVDMYFSEVDVLDGRRKGAKDDYNYIRSSEDISSGYSSAEPLPGGLSRTASMTNASKIRLRAKKSEDSNFILKDLDSLEFESLLSDPLSMHSKILLNRYPMLREQLQLQHYDEKGNGFEYGSRGNISPDMSNQRTDTRSLVSNEIDATKWTLFCKWLNESNFEMKSNERSSEMVAAVNSQEIEKDSSDDEFVDSTNETEQLNSVQQLKEVLPSAIAEANISSTVHEIEQNSYPQLETKVTFQNSSSAADDHLYETLIETKSQTNLLELPNQSLLSLNLSCGSSASDLTSENGSPRRPATHNKGKAPPVPSVIAQQVCDNIAETQDKDKKKKSLLAYIPSIFKPISPSNSSKNLNKETDIY